MFATIYRIAKSTGWRRCLIKAENGVTTVSEIAVDGLMSDLYDKSLDKLVLAGVNAREKYADLP